MYLDGPRLSLWPLWPLQIRAVKIGGGGVVNKVNQRRLDRMVAVPLGQCNVRNDDFSIFGSGSLDLVIWVLIIADLVLCPTHKIRHRQNMDRVGWG